MICVDIKRCVDGTTLGVATDLERIDLEVDQR